eukprot:4284236-Pleurochrysis_carterae.AAC.2
MLLRSMEGLTPKRDSEKDCAADRLGVAVFNIEVAVPTQVIGLVVLIGTRPSEKLRREEGWPDPAENDSTAVNDLAPKRKRFTLEQFISWLGRP